MTAMPIRDNQPGDDDEHAREYDAATGGWTKPVQPQPQQ